ncbi:MAG: hypothetical protein ACTSXG_00060 [Alphaproteobacteria bacterium]
MKILFILFIIFSFVPIHGMSSSNETFYVFDVGQGNSQLAVYTSGLAVLYDCGSSSMKFHPKLDNFKNKNYQPLFLKKNMQERTVQNIVPFYQENQPNLLRAYSNETSTTNAETKTAADNTKQYIKRTIQQHNIKLLVVFLSHPDGDHIDYISSVIPDGIPVIAFLSGDWFGDGGSNIAETQLSREVKKTLVFLSNREKTIVHFPYYFSLNDFDIRELFKDLQTDVPNVEKNYLTMRNFFKEFKGKNPATIDIFSKNLFNTMKKTAIYNNSPQIFQGSLFNLLEQVIDIDNEQMKNFDSFAEDLKKVYICFMNQPFDDINSQSAIVSFAMPSLSMRFTCTGDIRNEVIKIMNWAFPKTTEYFANKDFMEVLVLPHHGSKNNISIDMLRLIKPSLLIIPAGNGKQYKHPSYITIDVYGKFIQQFNKHNFFDYFKIYEHKENYLLSFIEDQDGHAISQLHSFNNTPIICTNILGTIKFDQDGVWSAFSDIICENQFHWKINFSERRQNFNPNLYTQQMSDNVFCIPGGECLYRMTIQNNEVAYAATQLR